MKEEKVDLGDLIIKLSTSEKGLSSNEAKDRLAKYGPNKVEEEKESILVKILKYFWGPIPWMIEVAAVLSLILGHMLDFTFIAILLFFNAGLAFFQEYQADNAIAALKKKLASKSQVLRDGKWQVIDAGELVPGDVIKLKLGNIVPADAVPMDGEYLSIDQSSLTGESLPVDKGKGEMVYSGSVVQKGEMECVVKATGKETYFGETIKLVEKAKPVSHFQKAVLQIGDFLIYVSLFLVSILIVVELYYKESFFNTLKFALILIVASIPVAMPAVLSVTMAIGASILSKMKAIVTRLQSIEEMAGVDTLLCDKTGTLTQNKLIVGDVLGYGGFSEEEVMLTAALASEEDGDVIDNVIIEKAKKEGNWGDYKQEHFLPFDPTIKRSEATIRGPGGETFEVMKGAPQVVLSACGLKGGQENIEQSIEDYAKKGYRTIGVGRKGNDGAWKFVGLIPLYDPPREDSKGMIEEAKKHGIDVKMLTGDNCSIARQIAFELGIGSKIYDADELEVGKNDGVARIADKIEKADGFAQVLPENKYEAVKALQSNAHLVGMTGDGVNDAPALKEADLGIAVSGATDAARASASLILTEAGLSVIIRAVEEARRIFERMNTYAIYRIAETVRIMIFVVLSIIIYRFYPITALMIILLALINDIPIMSIAYDHTLLPERPVRWDMKRVITTASILGGFGVVQTFLLMVIAETWFGVGRAVLQSVIFLKLSLSGHLMLFVVRARGFFMKKPHPSGILLLSILGTQLVAMLIVGLGIFMTAIPWMYIAYIWGYALVCMFINDGVKMLIYRHLGISLKRHKQFIRSSKATFMPFPLNRRNGRKQ